MLHCKLFFFESIQFTVECMEGNSKGPHNSFELYGTFVSVKQSSKKYLSHIYCGRKTHGPIQSKGKSHSPI